MCGGGGGGYESCTSSFSFAAATRCSETCRAHRHATYLTALPTARSYSMYVRMYVHTYMCALAHIYNQHKLTKTHKHTVNACNTKTHLLCICSRQMRRVPCQDALISAGGLALPLCSPQSQTQGSLLGAVNRDSRGHMT